MTTTRIREIPSELPHAHLYLDDVEEICRLLKDAVSAKPEHPKNPSVSFLVGEDLLIDSIEDLVAHGGSATKFTIGVGPYGAYLGINGSLPPNLGLSGVRDDLKMGVYGSIKAIFEDRQHVLKNDIFAVPMWIRLTLYVIGLPLLSVAITKIDKAPFYAIGYIVLVVVVGFIMLNPNRVTLARYRERSRLTAESRKGWVKAIFSIIAGAVIGKLVEHFASKLWPTH